MGGIEIANTSSASIGHGHRHDMTIGALATDNTAWLAGGRHATGAMISPPRRPSIAKRELGSSLRRRGDQHLNALHAVESPSCFLQNAWLCACSSHAHTLALTGALKIDHECGV